MKYRRPQSLSLFEPQFGGSTFQCSIDSFSRVETGLVLWYFYSSILKRTPIEETNIVIICF